MKSHFPHDEEHLDETEARYTQSRPPGEGRPSPRVHDVWTMQLSLRGSVQASVSEDKWRNDLAADNVFTHLPQFKDLKAILAHLTLKI